MDERLRAFLFPKVTPLFVLRLLCVAAFSYLFFGFVLTPFFIRGRSMEATYRDGGVNFIWKAAFWFSGPERGQVVAVRLAGQKVMYLKRVVALAGDSVEFRDGQLLVGGKEVPEPYVQGPCGWNLPLREVESGQIYVVGDNRGMPMEEHDFGQTSERRLAGVPLW